MALINITPIMTSNTTPTPYVLSASSVNGTYYIWKGFNATAVDSNDCWLTNGTTGYVIMDFSVVTTIDAISIMSRNDVAMTYQDTAPKSFALYGSNDNATYDLIKSFSNEIYWLATENRLFKLDKQVSYRYYKLILSSNNGHATATGFSSLKFWKDDGTTPTVTISKASTNYCLPRSSTLAIKQKQNDSREGLLGYANDDGNYGDLYLVNKIGKSQMPAARIKMDTLFDGAATTVGIYN
jgi:hypothetical protein